MPSFRRALWLAAILSTLLLVSLGISTRRNAALQNFHKRSLRKRLALVFPYNPAVDLPQRIWQTWNYTPPNKNFTFSHAASSWTTLNPEFEHEIVTDDAATSLIARLYAGVPEVQEAFDALPKPVLKADFFRYLVLLARGGVYSDIDTTALKPVPDWIPADMQPYGMVVGIEADPDRPDWQDWYARRIQFCQWTIVSKPGHPVLVDIVASITEETLRLKALDELTPEYVKNVMEFTGPGVWTDSLFNFFNKPETSNDRTAEPKNITWEHFAFLRQPIKESDVVVLPITSFSPGVGHMGSGSTSDPLAYVQHGFSATWKDDERSIIPGIVGSQYIS